MPPAATPQEQLLLADHIVRRLVGRASGRDANECLRNYPHDVYFVGCLRSQDGAVTQTTGAPHIPELLTKLAPVAFGGDFRIAPQDGLSIGLRLSWSSYYRIFPTLVQQQEHQRGLTRSVPVPDSLQPSVAPQAAAESDDSEEDSEDEDQSDDDVSGALTEALDGGDVVAPTEAPASNPTTQGGSSATNQTRRTDTLLLRFRKIECTASAVVVIRSGAGDQWTVDQSALDAAVEAELQRASAIVSQDPESFRATTDVRAQIRVPERALASEQQYRALLATLTTPIPPVWRWEIRCNAQRDSQDAALVQLSFVFANATSRYLAGETKDNPHIDAYLFETAASFDFANSDVRPFVINSAPQGFRYDRFIPARGFNCSIEGASGTFATTHVPVFAQPRYETRSEPQARFAELANQPLPTLDAILIAMEEYRTEWDAARQSFANTIPNWQERHSAEFDGDRQTFEQEIARFRAGRDLVRDNADIRLAFQLTNETFRRGPRSSWRLFQIVFLVSQISGIASLGNIPGSDPSELDRADIIYFPTGGGKTEAYLAVLVFHSFFDRLRGKAAGVTAWIRFPLRLLTLQQTQRMADVICIADLVRRENGDPRLSGRGVAGFGVGYFVGKTSTPNEILNSDAYQYSRPDDVATWRIANDAGARQRWKRLISCPSCRTQSIAVELDAARARLIHRCTNERCAFTNGHIPVYVIDNEIYRYLPTVIVGTIDKLASVGNQRKMAQLFGSVDGYCRTHGYYKGRCCQKDCDNRNLVAQIPAGLSGPTLFLQDELHLLKEGLGTFDSHYETFAQELLRALSPNSKLKIIASSATIENFRRQVEHLYDAAPNLARMFPGPGPALSSSFYAETRDYPQRLFVGLIPHNKTIFNAILEMLEYYHETTQELLNLQQGSPNPYGGTTAPGSEEWFSLLDLYVTSLAYFLNGRDLNSIRTDLDGHVSPLLQSSGHSPVDIFELTGSTSTDDVARILESLQTPKPGEERATGVLATSMVSHGVDIDRLNAMFFYGMPRQTAEYIQASSRVGRANVGIVFVCHHPARERDQSHYGLFPKFHQYLGQLVEPVAINRWAKFSINRTLPGLFMGVLLQLIANRADPRTVNRFYLISHVRQLYTSGNIRPQEFVEFLENAYRVTNVQTVAAQTFREEIRLRVQQFFDQIVQAGGASQFVSEALIPHPMTSLRDIDEPIPIHLDQDGATWSSRTVTR